MTGCVRRSWWAILAAGLVWCEARGARGDEAAAANYVQLALQHEAYGRQDIRQELLEAALLVAPEYAPAHWHLGHVRVGDQWMPVAEAQRLAENDPALATYQDLRDKALGDPRRGLALAHWCQKERWQDRTDLHYARIVLDPAADPRTRNEAMRKLDLVEVNGTILTQEEIERARESAKQLETAMKKWRGPLEKLRQKAVDNRAAVRNLAADELAQIDDPGVIPVSESFLLHSGAVFGEQLVSLLGRFRQHESTLTLVRFAVLSPWENVRQAAIEQLKRRPMHEYVPTLLDGLVAPIRSRFMISVRPDGALHYRHDFFRREAEADRFVTKDHVAQTFIQPIQVPLRQNERVPSGLKTTEDAYRENEIKFQLEAFNALYEAAEHERALARKNASIISSNEPIFVALEGTTGEMLGRDPADWQAWWQGYNEVSTEKPTYYEYYPTYTNYITQYHQPVRTGSCFAAGTPVWTESGIVPLETVKPGDRVLSQDLNTGELAYKVVLQTTALPPTSATVRVTVEDEPILMTRAHVVWVNNRGWRMAKELQAGDLLHGLDGVREIQGIEHLPPELEVYNLVVADFNTFFVGEEAVLVHDITYMNYRRPTPATVPGLAWK